MTRRHTASHALGALTARWLTDEDRADLRYLGRGLGVIAVTCLLALLLSCVGPLLDQYDAWRAQAQAHLDADRARQDEARYLAWVQQHCGSDAWWAPRTDGALVCTDKRGRTSSRVLIGAQP